METIKIDEFGTIYDWKNGELHRDGYLPTVEYVNGSKEYYKNGIQYTKELKEKTRE